MEGTEGAETDGLGCYRDPCTPLLGWMGIFSETGDEFDAAEIRIPFHGKRCFHYRLPGAHFPAFQRGSKSERYESRAHCGTFRFNRRALFRPFSEQREGLGRHYHDSPLPPGHHYSLLFLPERNDHAQTGYRHCVRPSRHALPHRIAIFADGEPYAGKVLKMR